MNQNYRYDRKFFSGKRSRIILGWYSGRITVSKRWIRKNKAIIFNTDLYSLYFHFNSVSLRCLPKHFMKRELYIPFFHKHLKTAL